MSLNEPTDVPKLRKTYDANEPDDGHPVRLTNQAVEVEFDHSEERDYEFTWWVPRLGGKTNPHRLRTY